jgi:tungstate transport system substrate-binding protein
VRRVFGAIAVVLLSLACSRPTASPAPEAPANARLVLATTTSTQDSGLLDVLVPLFEQRTGYEVKTVAVGTGAALALGGRGEADVVLVHAPEAEEAWMADGYGTDRVLVMHNDFILVGPSSDPAGMRGQASPVAALQGIASQGASWVSRDDSSGTDQLEKQLWRQAAIDPAASPGYLSSGQGMGATLTLADQRQAYTITDRATYLARRSTLDLVIVVEGDPQLLNIYHVMPVNPDRFPNVTINAAGARAFADFLVSPDVQQTIGQFGLEDYGQALFFPDAGKSEAQLRD